METTINVLTKEKFAEIYANEEFRNQIAYAHGTSQHEGFTRITCSYPLQWLVTDAQIQEAQEEIERRKAQVIAENTGKLMFVGMGMTYAERYADDVCNHRIRTEFVNRTGNKYFIEFGTGTGDRMRIDHSIDRTLEESAPYDHRQPYNNFAKLEHMRDLPKYTLTNVLNIVNKYFNCDFKEVVVDNYNVSTDDFISVSPKSEGATA